MPDRVPQKQGPQPRGLLPLLGAAQAPDSGLWSQADVVLVSAPPSNSPHPSLMCRSPSGPPSASVTVITTGVLSASCWGSRGRASRARPGRGLRRIQVSLEAGAVSICRTSTVKGCCSWCSSQPHSQPLQTTLSPTQGQGHTEQTCCPPPIPLGSSTPSQGTGSQSIHFPRPPSPPPSFVHRVRSTLWPRMLGLG